MSSVTEQREVVVGDVVSDKVVGEVMAGEVVGGVDTHGQTHHAAALDGLGRPLGDRQFPASTAGYHALLEWLRRGAGRGSASRAPARSAPVWLATCALRASWWWRSTARTGAPVTSTGKSDPIDAYAAARTAPDRLAHVAVPKARDGIVEAIRTLRVTRRGAVKARTATINQLKALLVTAPAEIREPLAGLTTAVLIPACLALAPDRLAGRSRPGGAAGAAPAGPTLPVPEHRDPPGRRRTPLPGHHSRAGMLTRLGVGVEVTGQLLTTVGDNPDRMRSEAAFAHLVRVSANTWPAAADATSHRLNRGGDQAANDASPVVLARLRLDERARAYVTRRTAEGLSRSGDHPLSATLRRPRAFTTRPRQDSHVLVVLAGSSTAGVGRP